MGMYTILSVFNNDRVTEHTNVGVSIYDDNGVLVLARADTPDRAIARGDMPASFAEHTNHDYFERLMRSKATLKQLQKTLESMGHAMSYVRFRDPQWTRDANQESLDRLFDSFVLGKRTEKKPTAESEP